MSRLVEHFTFQKFFFNIPVYGGMAIAFIASLIIQALFGGPDGLQYNYSVMNSDAAFMWIVINACFALSSLYFQFKFLEEERIKDAELKKQPGNPHLMNEL
jgi:hypothetical protein